MWQNGNFRWWEIVGWMGNLVFFSRFFVQWYATEKKKQVVVPAAFWWLSLVGSLLLLAYALFSQKNLVFIFSYAFTWIPYIRNLVIHHRHADAQLGCGKCNAVCPPKANYCFVCGNALQPMPAESGS
ncbi:MAG: putative rane protein [Pedosphaera sp.]|nr:putative rane protein [Pedosphaera sp.]